MLESDPQSFSDLVRLAEEDPAAFHACGQAARLAAIRAHYKNAWAAAREWHLAGASGRSVLTSLTASADSLVRGIVKFGLAETSTLGISRDCIAIVALGGYGRGELNPCSDLDLCLLYTGELDAPIRALNDFLVPLFWDVGFKMGYILQEVDEAIALSATDPEVLTSYGQARLLYGDSRVFGSLESGVAAVQRDQQGALLKFLKKRADVENLAWSDRDLHHPEPDLKLNAGGLRDAHVSRWILALHRGRVTLDDLEKLGALRAEDNSDFQESLDFIWRVRNELHFKTGKATDKLTFALQAHVAQALGYGKGTRAAIDRLMQDYYGAARSLQRLLRLSIGMAEEAVALEDSPLASGHDRLKIVGGELKLGSRDPKWFTESPPRLMELFWECSRHMVPLSHGCRERVKKNLHLVDDAFRQNELVRRYFIALCSRPDNAGLALREAAESGVLGRYIPEFDEIDGVVRYEDFHSYPVDEHTLRAVEAIAAISEMEGPVGQFLHRTLEHMRDPYILIIAILFHDLGKASGEEHVEEGVRLAKQICGRIGLSEEDTDRITFLVGHHMLMNHLAMYRDIENIDTVGDFAEIVKSPDRLRALLLLSYADLSAVGPGVWTEWKGALLTRLYLKTEQVLMGRAHFDDAFWLAPKAKLIEEGVPEALRPTVAPHLRDLGERYFVTFSPSQIVEHLAWLEDARRDGLSVHCNTHEDTGMSEVVVCTKNCHGLFAKIAGCLTSQLADVRRASMFTTPDGYALDSFAVINAANNRPLTSGQAATLTDSLRRVLLDDEPVQAHVDKARKRLFSLNQAHRTVPIRIKFDNRASRTDTVLDIETGDRTGLLYDIARVLAGYGIDFQSSHIVTDARQVRDAFYIQMGAAKIKDESLQETLRTALIEILEAHANV